MNATDVNIKFDLYRYLLGSYYQAILLEDIKEYPNSNTEYHFITGVNYFVGSRFTHNHANLKARTIKDLNSNFELMTRQTNYDGTADQRFQSKFQSFSYD